MVRLTALVLALIFLQGCAQSVGLQKQTSFSSSNLESAKLLYLEPDVSVKELGLTNAEEVPEWTAEGKKNLESQLQLFLSENTGIHLVKSAEATPQQMAILEEYIALYSLVAKQHLEIQGPYSLGWKAAKPENNFTLGPGLSFLKDENGLDIALMTVAEDYISSGGRVATQIGLLLIGGSIPMGHCIVHSGIVDLETGNIQWTNTALSGTHSLRSEESTTAMVEQLFKDLPLGKSKGQ